MRQIVTSEIAMDASFLALTEEIGTNQFLRGADALYASAAYQIKSQLISWDAEHLERAGAMNPTNWLAANP